MLERVGLVVEHLIPNGEALIQTLLMVCLCERHIYPNKMWLNLVMTENSFT